MSAVTICSDFGAQKNKVWHCFHCFSIYFPWSDGTGCHDVRFLNVDREINCEYSLEGLMLKQKPHTLSTWCKQPTQWKRPWCWQRLRAGEGAAEEEIVGCHHQLNGHKSEQTRSWWWTLKPGMLHTVHGVKKNQTQFSYWTKIRILSIRTSPTNTIKFYTWKAT